MARLEAEPFQGITRGITPNPIARDTVPFLSRWGHASKAHALAKHATLASPIAPADWLS
jgi:hypothetical protein